MASIDKWVTVGFRNIVQLECRRYLIIPVHRDDLSNDWQRYLITPVYIDDLSNDRQRYLITPVNRDDLSNDMATLPYYSSIYRRP